MSKSDGSLFKLWHSIYHLRWRQIIGQCIVRIRPFFENTHAFQHQNTPDYPGSAWDEETKFIPPVLPGSNPASELLAGRFTFLNRSHDIGWPPGLASKEYPLLWQFNLHYFDWLWALEYEQAKEVVSDWIENYDLILRQSGWMSYPLSLRLVNCLGFFFLRFRDETEADQVFLNQLWKSIYLQTEWLSRHLEFHIMGNHLFENGVALALAGSCFHGKDAERWAEQGEAILRREWNEQILPDGTHFERSPMYHLRLLYVLLLLKNLARPDLKERSRDALKKAWAAVVKLSHPDEGIALFGDAAFNVYLPLDVLRNHIEPSYNAKAETARYGNWSLPNAGYYGFRGVDQTSLICTTGTMGPDYLPAHGHADIFSFELSIKGQRVIVDSGVYDYEKSAMREYCRSTRAHNTLELNGEDQSECWGVFYVARRGKAHDLEWIPEDEGFTLRGWHDGYKRLAGQPIHHRAFKWEKAKGLTLVDSVTSNNKIEAVSRLHFHPDCQVEILSKNSARVEYHGGQLQIHWDAEGLLKMEKSWYCPEFNKRIPNSCLAFTAEGINLEIACHIDVTSKP